MTFDETKGPGRVFFWPEDSLELEWVAYQPLDNHVQNVLHLMSSWRVDVESFDLAIGSPSQCRKEREIERQRLIEGAKDHDWGKTQKFYIKQNAPKNKPKHWTYSYSGHRFLNPSDLVEKANHNDEAFYNLTLERAHHDYSVQEIVKDAYELKQRDIKTENYPKDLFILEMCDQIEAEVAVMAIQRKSGRNASFMEYEVTELPNQSSKKHKVFRLEPFPFTKDVDYKVYFRKDDLDQSERSSAWLKKQGFESYEAADFINITLTGDSDSNVVRWSLEEFYKVAPDKPEGFTPNELQKAVWQEWQSESAGLIVKAPTGVGKTEACVYPPLALSKRTILILPAKALVDDHKQRFEKVLKNLSSKGLKKRLLVDTGDNVELSEYLDGESQEFDSFQEKRHLYRADLIITTLDKFIYRFFAYGGGRKSYTFPLRINDKSRVSFIFDEAHSYEGTAFTNFQRLANTLYDQGHNITLMTATLPENYQTALQDPEDMGFAGRWDVIDFLQAEKQAELLKGKPADYGKRQLIYSPDTKTINFSAIEDFDAKTAAFDDQKQERVAIILEQIKQHWTGENRLIVTLDRVQDAAEVYKTVKNWQGMRDLVIDAIEPNLFLYHGRLDRKWRSGVYKNVKTRDDNQKPYVLVSTSAIEIGVDLDSNILITELCNPDALVQRIGRCNRKGNDANAKVIVVGSQIPEHLDAFGENRDAFNNYLDKLSSHNQKTIKGEFAQTIMGIFPKPVLTDPRASTAYDMLYKYVYAFELEYKNLHDLGFIATRSWDPTIEVLIPQGDDEKGNLKYDRLQIPVSRLSRGTDDAYWIQLESYKMHQDADKSWHGKWEKVDRGGDLYRGTYRIILDTKSEVYEKYEQDLGLVTIPKVFQRQRWPSDPPLKVRLSTWLYERTEEVSDTLFFASGEVEGKEKGKRVVFSYLAEPSLDAF